MKAPNEILHRAKVDLVRKYSENPSPWPDGIDWGSHWYTKNKAYWDKEAGVTGESPEGESPLSESGQSDSPAPEQITEIEVERLTRAGKSGRAIAKELGLSIRKIQTIQQKMQS